MRWFTDMPISRMIRVAHASIICATLLICGVTVSNLFSAETPHGEVSGTLLAADTQRALPHIRITLVDSADNSHRYHTSTNANGQFLVPGIAPGVYTIVTNTRAHKETEQKVTVRDGQTQEITVTLKPSEPFVEVFSSQNVYTTLEKPVLHCRGFAPADALNVTIYAVQLSAAINAWQGYMPQSFTLKGKDLHTMDLNTVPELTRLSAMTMPVRARDAEGVFLAKIPLGALSPGVYLAAVENGTVRGLDAIAVTNLGLVVKAVSSKLLAYAVDMTNSTPVAAAAIEVRLNDKVILSGKTGADGLLVLPLPAIKAATTADNDNGQQLQVVGHYGDNMAVASVEQNSPEDEGGLRAYTYTDRPVYRPGHTVYFKSVLRELHGNDYRVSTAKDVQVNVTDSKEDQVFAGKFSTNDYGTLSGEFVLNENALPGEYTITLKCGAKSFDASFSVAEYRKPEFEVLVKTLTKRVAVGDTFSAVVNAQYYFGAPVGGAKVTYEVTREPNWGQMTTENWDDDLPSPAEQHDYSRGGGEVVTSGAGITDATGQFHVTAQALPIANSPNEYNEYYDGMDWAYTVHATVTDISERSEDGSGSVLVTQGDFQVNATVENYLTQPGQPDVVTVHVLDYDGKPLAGVRGKAEVASVSWVEAQENMHVESVLDWQTDANGNALLSVTPKREGDYRVILHASDAHGRVISERCWLWVMQDDNGSFDYPYQDLDVRPAKRLYHTGDTAEVVVNTRYAPQQALLTYEGGGRLEQQTIMLKSKSTVIKVPVRADFMPNIHVSVCLIHGKKFLSGDAVINVSRERKALRVIVTPDLPMYEPGQQATFTIKTVTPEGMPAPSEVSFGLVDEAIYAIRADETENITSFFYPRRSDSAPTSFSFPEMYLSGEGKGGSTVRTRRFFPDTACWKASVLTDRAGIAKVTVTIPDSLTTWRATCRAVTLDTRVGQGTGSIVVSKPFLLRLETPRFLTQGDTATIAVIAHNLTPETLSVKLGLEVTGAELQNNVGGEYQVAPGGAQRVVWTLRAPDVGTVTLRAWGTTGPFSGVPLSDAMELSLPVVVKGRVRNTSLAGSVDTLESVTLPDAGNVIPGTGRLTIRLLPSYASAMLGSLDYLAHYPYGCTEQTMSSFLPDIVVQQLLKYSGTPNEKLQRETPKMVDAGLLKLYGFQHGDGGWGWWTYDASDPWMTAYVLFGLTRAQEAGFTVTQSVIDNGLDALQKQSEQRGKDASPSARAFMAYVLASNARAAAARKVIAEYQGQEGQKNFELAGAWGQSMLALAWQLVGQPANAQRILEPLWQAFADGTLDNRSRYGFEYYSPTDDAAALLFASTVITPHDARQEGLVRWLMERRRDDHWYSTRDTAFSLYGLIRYLYNTNELHPDLDTSVIVNGQTVLTRHIGQEAVIQPAITITLEKAQLPPGPLTIYITRTGTGKLYYSAALEQMVSNNLTIPVSNTPDLSITRSYRPLALKPGTSNADDTVSPSFDYKVGDTIDVKLQLVTKHDYANVMIEDPLPAGCEAFDRGAIDQDEWSYWWTNQIIRDKMVCFAVRYLAAGKPYTIDYHITAQTPGVFTALPARVYDMYNPSAWADAGTALVRVHENK